jgi:hypothetical protein
LTEFGEWLHFVNRWPDWLRWTLLLPLSIATAIVWWLLVRVLIIAVGATGDEEARSAVGLGSLLANAFVSAAFILSGAFIAPRGKIIVAVGFGGLVLCGAAALWFAGPSFRQIVALELTAGIGIAWVWVARDVRKAAKARSQQSP